MLSTCLLYRMMYVWLGLNLFTLDIYLTYLSTVCLVLSVHTSDRPGVVILVEDDACVGGGPVRGLPHHPLYHQTIEEGFIQKRRQMSSLLIWGTELLQFLAALAILHQEE